MKDKKTNVGYGAGMADGGGGGGGRGGGRNARSPKWPRTKGEKAFVRQTNALRKNLKQRGMEPGPNPYSTSSIKSYRSISANKPKAPVKPSTGKMSSRYAGKMKAMGKKAK